MLLLNGRHFFGEMIWDLVCLVQEVIGTPIHKPRYELTKVPG